jgi:hypothetical protein
MRKIYFKIFSGLLLVLALQMTGQAQNLLSNGDFEKDGGSLNDWGIASGTTLGSDGSDYYAVLHGENGVLYQKVTGVAPGETYKCTMDFRNVKVRQTTGFGYAIEKDVALTIPEFTIGATNLKNLCEPNGMWNVLESGLEVQDTTMFYEVTIPDSATAIYVCIGCKGAVSDLQVNSVVFEKVGIPSSVFDRDLYTAELSVYPVPAKFELTLELNFDQNLQNKNFQAGIYELTGKRIRTETLFLQRGQARIQVQDLNPGMYFIAIPELNKSAKFVIGD